MRSGTYITFRGRFHYEYILLADAKECRLCSKWRVMKRWTWWLLRGRWHDITTISIGSGQKKPVVYANYDAAMKAVQEDREMEPEFWFKHRWVP